MEIKGKFNTATIFTRNIDEKSKNQIKDLCDDSNFKESKIRIMPDVHYGSGCTIGTVMTFKDVIYPSLVGVDLGCGVTTLKTNLKKKDIDLEKFDRLNTSIPTGYKCHKNNDIYDSSLFRINDELFTILDEKDKQTYQRQLGTLGGGNHFISLDEDSKGYIYISVHSGSRKLGHSIAKYFSKLSDSITLDVNPIIKGLKAINQEKLIEPLLKEIRKDTNLKGLRGKDMELYISFVMMAQRYATCNRDEILTQLIDNLRKCTTKPISFLDIINTIHNYIEKTENGYILRKGAISAKKDEKLVIPLNMKDGIILGVGLGNINWLNSAPHGAGRIMSRTEANNSINLKDYKEEMKDIYSSSVVESTLDEAPGVYKSSKEIIDNILPTVGIIDQLKPIYNKKDTESYKNK